MNDNKPFRILGVQQIAIGGPDKQKLRALWVDIFGLSVKSTFVSERENVDEDICALGEGAHAVEVDLIASAVSGNATGSARVTRRGFSKASKSP